MLNKHIENLNSSPNSIKEVFDFMTDRYHLKIEYIPTM